MKWVRADKINKLCQISYFAFSVECGVADNGVDLPVESSSCKNFAIKIDFCLPKKNNIIEKKRIKRQIILKTEINRPIQ